MNRQSSSMAFPLGLAVLSIALACTPESTAPSDSGPISLLIVTGDGQSGVVGTELPLPLVIKATNSKGNALSDVTVNFRVTSGGGSMFAGVASTDAKGIASDYWTLGTSTADAQRVEVRAVLSNGQKQVFGIFTATPLSGPATQIALDAGDNQSATVSTPVATPPSVVVRDQFNNPVSGVTVIFAVATGGGSLTGGNQTTNAAGIAAVGSWTLGAAAGPNTLTATSSGLSGNPVTFTATGTAGAVSLQPTTLTIAAGSTGTLVVTIGDAAPSGGTVVFLTSSDAAVTVPPTVTIPEGATSEPISVVGLSAGEATVTATLNGTSATSLITVVTQ